MASSKKEKLAPERNMTPMSEENKKKALDSALAAIEKAYGKGAVMRMGDRIQEAIPVIPTGCITLDVALGVGGIPRGRIIEIYGPESSGKTTVSLHIVAEAQRLGGTAAFIDAEHALDPHYAGKLGVNVNDLFVSQPDTGEEGLEICDALVRSAAVDIIVVDSVAALVPKAEINGDMGESFVGVQARLMSQALRKLAGVVSKTNTTVVFINQLRDKIGVMYGSPETTTGGRALKFFSSVRLDVRRCEQIKVGGNVIGNHTKVKVVKNKVAPPFRVAEFDILYGEGISREGCLIDLAVAHDIIHKSGAWFSYLDERIGQGRDNARLYLKSNPEIAAAVEQTIREKLAEGELTAEVDLDENATAEESTEAGYLDNESDGNDEL